MKFLGLKLPSLTDADKSVSDLSQSDEPKGSPSLSVITNEAESAIEPAPPEPPAVKFERALAKLRKKASFVVAEATLAAKRASREAAMAKFREACREHERTGGGMAAAVAAADAEVMKIDIEINAARKTLYAEREALQPRFDSLVAEHRRVAAEMIVNACNAIEEARSVECVIERWAVRAGIKFAPSLLNRDIGFLKAEAIALAGKS
jgi:hypothetical protein